MRLRRRRCPADCQQPPHDAWQPHASKLWRPVQHRAGTYVEAGAVNRTNDGSGLEPAATEVAAHVRALVVDSAIAVANPRYHDHRVAGLERLDAAFRHFGRLA